MKEYQSRDDGNTPADLRSNLLNHIQKLGSQRLSSVETLRFHLADEACITNDMFYLVFHQVFCLRSRGEKKMVDRRVACSPSSIDQAFDVMKDIIGSNTRISKSSLRWFSSFPDPILLSSTRALPTARRPKPALDSVAEFLVGMAEHWSWLVPLVRARHYPLLVDEMACLLRCSSPTLLVKLFMTSLESLDKPGASKSTALWDIFKTDMAAQRLSFTRGRVQIEQKVAMITSFNQGRIAAYERALEALEPPTVIDLTAED